jgi:hypothetical protein
MTMTLDGPRQGETYDGDLDYDRLNEQAKRVYLAMIDMQWHTLAYLAERTGDPEASVSARLRDLRKPRFGSHEIATRRVPGVQGLWEYRLTGERAPSPRVAMRDRLAALQDENNRLRHALNSLIERPS